ncbi:MAG TPA: hypothetical protein VMA73_33645 [Streptosporangiaceae bacterium]|nr:hypothetical protein [Streptosporangiaceae bacterium]
MKYLPPTELQCVDDLAVVTGCTGLGGRAGRPAVDGTRWHAMDRYLGVSPVNPAFAADGQATPEADRR